MFCKLDSPFATETLPFFFQGESDKAWVGKFLQLVKLLTFHRCFAPRGGYLNLLDEPEPAHERNGWVTKKEGVADASVQLFWLQHWDDSLELVSVLREAWAATICH